jgi:DNA-nicking Smr family endonuclease
MNAYERTLGIVSSIMWGGMDRESEDELWIEGELVEIPITDVFDLHSVPPRDAKAVVEAYLEEAYSKGFPFVRIIHGRGIGAQREMVRKVLASTPFVAEFSDAPLEAGGWGATIVTFRPGPLPPSTGSR